MEDREGRMALKKVPVEIMYLLVMTGLANE